jgi:hypothetical protein
LNASVDQITAVPDKDNDTLATLEKISGSRAASAHLPARLVERMKASIRAWGKIMAISGLSRDDISRHFSFLYLTSAQNIDGMRCFIPI